MLYYNRYGIFYTKTGIYKETEQNNCRHIIKEEKTLLYLYFSY